MRVPRARGQLLRVDPHEVARRRLDLLDPPRQQLHGTWVLVPHQMHEARGQLDDALQKRPERPRAGQPQLLERLVRLEEITMVELLYARHEDVTPLLDLFLREEGLIAIERWLLHI